MIHSAPTVNVERPGKPARPLSPRLVVALAVTVLAVACLDLAGWWLHIPLLTSILPDSATMKPNTARCLIALVISVLVLRERGGKARGPVRNFFSVFAPLVAIAISGITLLEYLFHRNLGIDQIVLHVRADRFDLAAGRMSHGTAVGVLVTALAFLVLDRVPRISTALLLTGEAMSLSAIIGFLFNAGPLYGVPWLRSEAVHTASCLLAIQLAGLAARPMREPFRSLSHHARHEGRTGWLLLGTTVVPALVALPLLWGMRTGVFNPAFTMALLVVLLIGIQTLILWQDSAALDRVELRRRQTELALLQSEKLAVVGRLAASISHEINNPLEAVGNLLYLIRHSSSLEEAARYATQAERELGRVSQITAQTLSFYRENRRPAACQVSEVLNSAVSLLNSRIASSGVVLQVDFRDGTQPITCRDGELRQVFINLISNALEATPNAGMLVVRVRDSRRWDLPGCPAGVRVLIADTGTGISRETQRKIFEPFFTTKAETGNGLGLWVARDLIVKHGGSIRLWSRDRAPHTGTVFCVFLPYEFQVI
jgi:signal transduction histidine kinase